MSIAYARRVSADRMAEARELLDLDHEHAAVMVARLAIEAAVREALGDDADLPSNKDFRQALRRFASGNGRRPGRRLPLNRWKAINEFYTRLSRIAHGHRVAAWKAEELVEHAEACRTEILEAIDGPPAPEVGHAYAYGYE